MFRDFRNGNKVFFWKVILIPVPLLFRENTICLLLLIKKYKLKKMNNKNKYSIKKAEIAMCFWKCNLFSLVKGHSNSIRAEAKLIQNRKDMRRESQMKEGEN